MFMNGQKLSKALGGGGGEDVLKKRGYNVGWVRGGYNMYKKLLGVGRGVYCGGVWGRGEVFGWNPLWYS
ncbi:hypothetical protein DPMN_029123, partial [Dreissena polymorpha]